jgi:hypothetical protein
VGAVGWVGGVSIDSKMIDFIERIKTFLSYISCELLLFCPMHETFCI